MIVIGRIEDNPLENYHGLSFSEVQQRINDALRNTGLVAVNVPDLWWKNGQWYRYECGKPVAVPPEEAPDPPGPGWW